MNKLKAIPAVGSMRLLGARPNVALAISTPEWSERYRRALRQLCKTADDEALDPDNDLAMQSRMMGESPEVAANCVANEIEAWSAPNASNSATGDRGASPAKADGKA